ncbi:hypothetical protein BGW38_006553 [Lunasporangiospora selenospora]|uniref:Uncharacterized protein n=1 Tax=Lunasporangiospora selenospora TaxID=979761 RepID=A0A9P6G3T2_9FUNG|nr:hypothetical protein BGW38_006553 [Lunasporangiospora selenospora]
MQGPDPSISSSKVKNPAQLVSKAAGVKKNVLREENREQSLDILFRFLRKFSEAIPSFQWCHFLNSLVQKTYGAPSDQILVRVWNSLAVSISDCPEAIIALSQRITIILEQQGVLTESMLEEALEASDEALDDLRLSRLSPLLILKTIPAQGFVRVFRSLESESGPLDVKAVPSQLSKVLETRTDNELEFSLVRKLALAIKHGIYPDSSLETIYGQLKKCFPTKADNDTVGSPTSIELEEGRAWLFAFYNWVLNWSIQSNSQEQNENDIQWIYRIVSEVFFKIITLTSSSASEGDNENGLYKMQLGVLDVLSKLIIATTPFYTRRPTGPFWSKLKKLSRDVVPDSNNATIEELVEDEGDEMQAESLSIPKSAEDLLLALLADVLGGATAPISHNDSCDSNISRAICFANVLIMAMQSLAPMKQQSHAGGKHPASPGAMVSMAQEDKDTDYPPSAQWIPCALMDLITPALGSALTTYLQENAEEALEATGNTDPTLSLVQACIQVLYTGTSVASAVERRTTSRNTNLWLIETAVVGLENRSFTIAVSALKLLAAIAASKSLTADMLTEHRLIAIRRGLTRLHQSKELKTGNGMAPEISVLVDKMWELVG